MPDPNYKLFDLKISTITPLHIGTGRELLRDYDYDVAGKRTWVIDQAALLDAQNVDDPKVAAQLAETPPAELLEDKDFVEGNRFFRYVIRGEPRSDQEGAVIQEQFKDVYDQPYLPGSSLKGALRTALGWHVWKEKDLEPDVEKLMDPRKGQPYPGRFAATNYEHDVFGKEANKTKNDFLRALHVSDSKPLPPSCLLLLNVRVINPGTSTKPASDIPVELEAIRPDTTFETSLKLDLALFSQWAQRYGLHLSGREWLTDLPRIANTHARDQIVREAKWFRHLPGGNRVAEFYERLEQTPLDGQRFFLRLGWGTGWENKTFGSRLQADEDFMNYIVSYYRMKKGNGEMGDAFPASRRASVRVKGEAGEEIGAPLGWVLVEMQERV